MKSDWVDHCVPSKQGLQTSLHIHVLLLLLKI